MKHLTALFLLLLPFTCLAQEITVKEAILPEIIEVRIENDGFIYDRYNYFQKGDSCLVDKGSELSFINIKKDSVKVKNKNQVNLLAYCPAGTEFLLTKKYFLKIVEKGRIE